jgi:hypothetical protein
MYRHILQAVLFFFVNVGSINVAIKGIRNGRRTNVPANLSNTEAILLLDEKSCKFLILT